MSLLRLHPTVVVLLVLLALAPTTVNGQESEDAAVPEAISVAASGLEGPQGFLVGDDGTLYVSLAGRGGDDPGVFAPIPDSPILGGPTASVVRVEAGCSTPIAEGLPSAIGATGRTFGATDVAVLDDQLYVLVAGGGAAHGHPDTPNGVYRVDGDGGTELVADLSTWVRANPAAVARPLDVDPEGLPSAMSVIDGQFWIVDSNARQVLRVGVDGTITRLVDLSALSLTPTNLTPAPTGGAYITVVGSAPYAARGGKVILVEATGAVTDVWTGLTTPVALAVDEAGVLYALEGATRTSLTPPILGPRTGRVVRQLGPDRREVLVRRLDRPTALFVGLGGVLYVAVPGTGAASGAIVRFVPESGVELTAPVGPLVGPECEGPMPQATLGNSSVGPRWAIAVPQLPRSQGAARA